MVIIVSTKSIYETAHEVAHLLFLNGFQYFRTNHNV